MQDSQMLYKENDYPQRLTFSIDLKDVLSACSKGKVILEHSTSLEVGDRVLIRKEDGFEIVKIKSTKILEEILCLDKFVGKVKCTDLEFMIIE